MSIYELESFHNTTNEQGELLFRSESKAAKQERDILSLFPKGAYLSQYSARRAFESKYGSQLLVASCSRAFANLTRSDKLIKCDGKDGRELVQVEGEFGKNVYCWTKA